MLCTTCSATTVGKPFRRHRVSFMSNIQVSASEIKRFADNELMENHCLFVIMRSQTVCFTVLQGFGIRRSCLGHSASGSSPR